MKTWLQHSLHLLNLWRRVGGRFSFFFRIYETYCWQPFLRPWLGLKSKRVFFTSANQKEWTSKCAHWSSTMSRRTEL
jgi:hypothetical protein